MTVFPFPCSASESELSEEEDDDEEEEDDEEDEEELELLLPFLSASFPFTALLFLAVCSGGGAGWPAGDGCFLLAGCLASDWLLAGDLRGGELRLLVGGAWEESLEERLFSSGAALVSFFSRGGEGEDAEEEEELEEEEEEEDR